MRHASHANALSADSAVVCQRFVAGSHDRPWADTSLANEPHFAMTKAGATVQIFGAGPFAITYAHVSNGG
jgi:hypothetical protein